MPSIVEPTPPAFTDDATVETKDVSLAEFIQMREEVRKMRQVLLDEGLMTPDLGRDATRTKRLAVIIGDAINSKLKVLFGWKPALFIALVIILVNVSYVIVFTYRQVNNCEPLVQIFEASQHEAILEQNGLLVDTRHLCSTEMLSFRNQLFTIDDLKELDNIHLVKDRECHLNGGRTRHAVVDLNSTSPRGHPSIITHDLGWTDWYPCMFPGGKCGDYGLQSRALMYPWSRGGDLCSKVFKEKQKSIIDGCNEGLVSDSASRFPPKQHRPNLLGPYRCDHHPQLSDLEQRFLHFDTCQGLISATFVVCPNVLTVLGAACGFTSLITLVALVLVLPIGLCCRNCRSKHGDEKVGIKEGVVAVVDVVSA